MSLRIVFDGQEYDSVEAMPPDIRKEYEAALDMLSKTGDRDVVSKLQHASSLRVRTHVRRRIVVSGKEYGSIEEMPLEIRRRYEQAIARSELRSAGRLATPDAPPPPAIRPPPLLQDDQTQRSPLVRVAWYIAIGILLLWWLVRRS